jgi:poly-gamma-glutamate synthesis protein (capsule biosynthesis protein)
MPLRRSRTSITLFFLLIAASSASAKERPCSAVRLTFVGDIMLAQDEETGKLVERGVDPFEPCSRLLKCADVAIGNLECVVAVKGDRVR